MKLWSIMGNSQLLDGRGRTACATRQRCASGGAPEAGAGGRATWRGRMPRLVAAAAVEPILEVVS
jgi:hypothetical protein